MAVKVVGAERCGVGGGWEGTGAVVCSADGADFHQMLSAVWALFKGFSFATQKPKQQNGKQRIEKKKNKNERAKKQKKTKKQKNQRKHDA